MTDRRHHFFALLPLLGLLVIPPDSAGADAMITEQDLFSEIPVVRAASRFEQSPDRAPASVTVITGEMIDLSGAQSFVDIFRLVPGFQSYYVSNNRYGVSYHGIGREFPNQIEVMVNGRSVYETLFSSVNWSTLGIGLDDIDRIEIVRGSNAPAQGSNAFLGSVNIITVKPVQEKSNSVRVAAGDTRSRRVSLTHNGRAGEVDYRLSLGYDHNSGFPGLPEGRLEDGHELTYGNLRGTYTPTIADTVDIFAGYAHDRIGWGDSDHPDDYSIAHTLSSFQSLHWNHAASGRHEFELQAYHNKFKTTNLTELGPVYALLGIDEATAEFLTARQPPPPEIVALFAGLTGLDPDPAAAVLGELNSLIYGGFGHLSSERYDLQLQHNFVMDGNLRGTWGVGIRYDGLNSDHPQSYSEEIDEVSFRLYNHNEWRATDRLTFNLGAMVEDTHVGMLFSPRVSANYQLTPAQSLRIARARGNRAPSLLEANEMSVSRVGEVVFDILRIADPDLREETIDSYELGYRYRSSAPGLTLDVRLFREEISDVIDEGRELSPPEVEIFGDRTFKRLENRDYWEFTGGEIEVNYQFSADTFARLHYTSIDFDPEIGPPRPPFDQVYKDDRVARHSAGLLVEHRLSPRWSVSLNGYHQSGLRWEDGDSIDDINRVDAQLRYGFRIGAVGGIVRFIAQNLGGTYSEFNDNNRFETRYFIAAELDLP